MRDIRGLRGSDDSIVIYIYIYILLHSLRLRVRDAAHVERVRPGRHRDRRLRRRLRGGLLHGGGWERHLQHKIFLFKKKMLN